jgi:hypothetical protein
VAAARFRHAPHFADTLVAEAEKLSVERAKLEQALAALAEREEDVRSGWRLVASAIPGSTADLMFEDGVAIPSRRPTEPHVGIVGHVTADSWPSWFFDCVRAAKTLYAPRDREGVTA